MRLRRLATALPLLVGCWASGCAAGAQPYRFSAPLLGSADLPPAPLRDPRPDAPSRARDQSRATVTSSAIAYSHPTVTRTIVDQNGVVRTVTAPVVNVASAAAAAAVLDTAPAAAEDHRQTLPAPNQLPKGSALPPTRAPGDLRALVGYRDARGPLAATLAVMAELRPIDHSGIASLHVESGAELVEWADRHDRLHDALAVAQPGDLLVFNYTDSAEVADCVAIVVARDAKGVTEYMYVGNGVWRRGFVDPTRPHERRRADGLVSNTFMRTGSRYPPKGTHYLAGELLAHVIAIR